MLNLKSFYSRSVDLLKQVQEQVQAKPPPSSGSSAAITLKSTPGNDIVSRHDKQWSKIVANGIKSSNALVAQDNNVKIVADRCEEELSAWNNLQSELNSLGSIVDNVDSLRAEMEALCGQLEHLDMALDGHLQAKEQRDMLRWKKEISNDTESFKLSRAKELANFEKSLKAEHARRTRQKAEDEARTLREVEAEKRIAQKRAELQKKKEQEAEKLQGASLSSIVTSAENTTDGNAEAKDKVVVAEEQAKETEEKEAGEETPVSVPTKTAAAEASGEPAE